MLARIRKAMDEKDEGFTLIELLVVIIIIGILAAIAIPVFLNQRKKGYDTAVKADLKRASTFEEVYLTDYFVYSTDFATNGAIQTAGFRPTNGVTITGKVVNSSDGYCLTGVHAKNPSVTWYYDSSNGGLQPLNSAKPANC